MKKIKNIAAFFLLLFAFLLVACESATGNAETTTQTVQTENPAEDNAYQSITCYETKGYQSFYVGFRDSDRVLLVSCPKEWNFTKNKAGGFDIKRDGREVGTLFLGSATDSAAWKTLNTEQEHGDFCINKSFLEKSGTGDTLAFRHRFEFQYTEKENAQNVTLIVNYAELDVFTKNKILISTAVCQTQSDTEFGALSDARKEHILILGNSFVGTSNIGSILSEMLEGNGKDVTVNAISRGYATVETYINDSEMMRNIEGCRYDIIFICGFYSTGELNNLKILSEACERSRTRLVIFPAHNENSSVIQSAVNQNPTLAVLNWKDEINKLIKNGAKQRDMCIDDQYQHSTPLAGYVGAHMIYRALYGECPKNGVEYAIEQSYIDQALPKGYAKTGSIALIDPDRIHYWD